MKKKKKKKKRIKRMKKKKKKKKKKRIKKMKKKMMKKKKRKKKKGMEKKYSHSKFELHKRTASLSFSPAHTDENKYTTQTMPDPRTLNRIFAWLVTSPQALKTKQDSEQESILKTSKLSSPSGVGTGQGMGNGGGWAAIDGQSSKT